MARIVSSIAALAVAAMAVRRIIQAKQGAKPASVIDHEDLQAKTEKAKAKSKQTLENAKENVEGVAELAKDKVRDKLDR